MNPFFKANILVIIMMLLMLVFFFYTCKRLEHVFVQGADTTITNTYRHYDTTIINRPTVVEYIPSVVKDTQFIPSPEYATLIKQYQAVVEELTKTRRYQQKYPIDTIGSVTITDTVSRNEIVGRSFTTDITIPEKTVTITKTLPPKTKFYIGFGLEGNKSQILNQADLNLLLINKKDRGYQIGTGVDFNGRVNYRIGTYFKF